MTTIRINYNPYLTKTQLFFDGNEVETESNKVLEFIADRTIQEWLSACKVSKYREWNGILLELINTVNDDALEIEFEGRIDEFVKFENALNDTVPKLEADGWKNLWKLNHIPNYEIVHTKERFADLIKEAREFCQTRQQLTELDEIATGINKSDNLIVFISQINELESFVINNANTAGESGDMTDEVLWRQLLSIYSKIMKGE